MKNLIKESNELYIEQVHEKWELLGFETRNKYRVLDESKNQIAFAAEKSTGIGGAIFRNIFGHWRSFSVVIYDQNKNPVYNLRFPFRWFFKTLHVSDFSGRRIGHLEERFAFFRKKFDVFDINNKVVARINSSFFRFWTFEFFHNERSLGKIQKKWSGIMSEVFTDKDNFIITFNDSINEDLKVLMLSTCFMVDIIYFENNKTDAVDLIS